MNLNFKFNEKLKVRMLNEFEFEFNEKLKKEILN